MAITAGMVKELRERTGAGMMECKKALTETNGDMEAAIDLMRKSGAAKADKKAGRIAAEGRVVIALTADAKRAAVIEVNSETDFAAKDSFFVAFADEVGAIALANNVADVETLSALTEARGRKRASVPPPRRSAADGAARSPAAAESRACGADAGPGAEQRRLFALARDGEQQHRPRERRAPGLPACEQRGVWRQVVLEVAAHANLARTGAAQALRIGLALRERQRQGLRPRVAGLASKRSPRAVGSFSLQPRIGQHQRDAARLCGRQQLGQTSVSISTPMAGRNCARKRRTAPGVSKGSQVWRSPSRSSSRPASRPVAVLWVSSRRSLGRRSRSAATSAAAARVSPSDTACSHSQPAEGASR